MTDDCPQGDPAGAASMAEKALTAVKSLSSRPGAGQPRSLERPLEGGEHELENMATTDEGGLPFSVGSTCSPITLPKVASCIEFGDDRSERLCSYTTADRITPGQVRVA